MADDSEMWIDRDGRISQRYHLGALEPKRASDLKRLERSTPDQAQERHSMATKQLGYFVHGH